MTLLVTDVLRIRWGGGEVKGRPYQEYLNIKKGSRIKVVFSGDTTESPITISTKSIIEIVKFHDRVVL